MKKKIFEDSEKSKKSLSIKKKLIIGYIFVILFLSILSIVSFLILQSSINKFDEMIETIFIANEIENCSNEISAVMTDYYNERNEDYEKKIQELFITIDRDMKLLNKLIIDKLEKIHLEWIDKTNQNILNLSNEATKLIREKDLTESFVKIENLKKEKNSIVKEIKEIISLELTNNRTIKQRLIENTRILGFIIIILITIFSILCIFGSFIFSNQIVKPLKDVSILLKKIAAGEGDLTQYLAVQTNDEVGLLSKNL